MTVVDTPYIFRQSKRAKRLSLRILADQTIEIVLPVGCSERKGLQFFKQNHGWVLKNIRTKPQKSYQLITSLHLKCIDKRYQCQYLHMPSKRCRLRQPLDDVLIFSGDIIDMRCCEPVLFKWLKIQAQRHLLPMLQDLSEALGFVYRQAMIRMQKTRWGSCSSKGDICLNARLLYLEPELVRYVLIHELCHLKEMNHSSRFWGLVVQHVPNYKALIQQLNSV